MRLAMEDFVSRRLLDRRGNLPLLHQGRLPTVVMEYFVAVTESEQAV